MTYLDEWNAMSADGAAAAVLACCGSTAWAQRLAARRPLGTLPELLAASDSAWWPLAESDWKEAFDSHPRIGETTAIASGASLRWSAGEQSTAMVADDDARRRLAAGNLEYEQRFGRTFIICAKGKSLQQIAEILELRIRSTPEAELHEAAEQQRQTTHIRLRKWLAAKEQEYAR